MTHQTTQTSFNHAALFLNIIEEREELEDLRYSLRLKIDDLDANHQNVVNALQDHINLLYHYLGAQYQSMIKDNAKPSSVTSGHLRSASPSTWFNATPSWVMIQQISVIERELPWTVDKSTIVDTLMKTDGDIDMAVETLLASGASRRPKLKATNIDGTS